MPKLSVNLVIRNEEKYLPFLLSALKRQTFKEWELILVDNASTDKSVEIIKRGMEEIGVKYTIISNNENLGFAAGHNQAFKITSAPYFLLQNPDMYLMPNVFEKMVEFLDDHQNVAVVAPRLMRWDFEKVKASFINGLDIVNSSKEGFTLKIDSIGIKLYRNRRALEWLTKQTWAKDSENEIVRKIYEKSVVEVFGASGALAIYRKEKLNTVLLPENNLFDPTYHSYKEDLDLAYRLQNAGFQSFIILDTIAYHDRTSAGPAKINDWQAIKNKKQQSEFTRFHSYKNHLMTLYKNEYWQNFIIDFPFIFWYELKKFLYLLFSNPTILFNGFKEIIKNFLYTQKARKSILKTRKMYWKGIRRWL